MGCQCSNEDMNADDHPLLECLQSEIALEKFYSIRERGTYYAIYNHISTLGTDCSHTQLRDLPNEIKKACFIVAVTKNKKENDIDVGPLNDALITAKGHIDRGFMIYFLVNPEASLFFKFLRGFLSQTLEELHVCLTGTCIDAQNDQESNQLCFTDKDIPSNQITDFVNAYKRASSFVLFTFDYNHIITGNSIVPEFFGNGLLPNTMSITTSTNRTEINGHGYLTFNLYKLLSSQPKATFEDIHQSLSHTLEENELKLIISSNPEALKGRKCFL